MIKINLSKSSKTMLICLFFVLSLLKVYPQVTIGSASPPEDGALLALKEFTANSDNETSNKGLLYPRVKLEDVNELYPMYSSTNTYYTNKKDSLKKVHTGLIVYNVSANNGFSEGLVIWNGSEWRKLTDNRIIAPQITALLCSGATIIPNSYTKGVAYDGVLKIPYTGGNGGTYASTESSSTINGLHIERIGGVLANGGGEVMYRISGTPTVSSPTLTTFPIDFLDNTCNVAIGADVAINTLQYIKKTVPLVADGSTNTNSKVEFGNLIVRYTYDGGATPSASPTTSNMWVQFQTKLNTHLLYWYEKTGAGAEKSEYMSRYGQIPAITGTWYTFKDGNKVGSTVYTGDLNAAYRDIARAIIVLQNDDYREIYRLYFNAYTTVAANGSVPQAQGSFTVFIEKLE